jgi:hypothetical protein
LADTPVKVASAGLSQHANLLHQCLYLSLQEDNHGHGFLDCLVSLLEFSKHFFIHVLQLPVFLFHGANALFEFRLGLAAVKEFEL